MSDMPRYLSRGLVCSECQSRPATHTLRDRDNNPTAYYCDQCAQAYILTHASDEAGQVRVSVLGAATVISLSIWAATWFIGKALAMWVVVSTGWITIR